MKLKRKKKIHVMQLLNVIALSVIAFICVMPFINVLALSLSSREAVMSGSVGLWPVQFTLSPYEYVLKRQAFWQAFLISVKRVALGGSINIFLTVLLAYPLSKDNSRFHFRTFYVWFLFLTMLFSGGLIPTYMLVNNLKLMDSIWALVLPSAVPVFNVVLMLNFFRQVPRELEEAACIDGAGHVRILSQIFIPVSLPAIATITLFSIVGHWNAWFDGLIYMNRGSNYPLQSYLQTIIIDLNMEKVSVSDYTDMNELTDRTLKCAQIFVATVPILALYPYLQKYFVTGIVLGSVKG